MVDRILRHGPAERADATVPRTPCLAKDDVLVIGVANLADGGVTVFVDQADFTGRQTDLRVSFVARHERGRPPGSADHLGASAWSKLDVVDRHPDRDSPQGQAIAEFSRSSRTAHQPRPNLQTHRSKNISLFAIFILDQSQTGGAAGIVFDGCDGGFDAVL